MSPQSLPDRLAKALLSARWFGVQVDINPGIVTEALVPAVLAALTVEPDDRGRYYELETRITPTSWVRVHPDGVETKHDYFEPGEITPDEVERAGLVLLSAAQEMRRHQAWKEGE